MVNGSKHRQPELQGFYIPSFSAKNFRLKTFGSEKQVKDSEIVIWCLPGALPGYHKLWWKHVLQAQQEHFQTKVCPPMNQVTLVKTPTGYQRKH